MDWYWIFGMMLFCHVIEDFHIQGILADMKQKKWWYEQFAQISASNCTTPMPMIMHKYGKDYIVALLMHGFEWSFIVHIPMMWFYGFEPIVFASIIVNALIHSCIDDLKCNRMKTNLIQDQILHIIQIAVSLAIITVVL